MKETKEKVESLGLKEAFEEQQRVQQEELEAWIREIIREEIVNYNQIFMSKFGVDEDGIIHLTNKDLN